MSQPFISVIITTKNEEANIANCLESIKKQSYLKDKIEIILVDNNSSDQTIDIAKKYTSHIYNFGPERSAQRNYGASKAHGEYFLYLDADMILSEKVIENCVSIINGNPETIALYIPEIIMGENFWNKVRKFERSFYTGTAIDAVRFIKTNIFQELGGFDLTLTGPEDWDFDKKIKQAGKVSICQEPLYHNEGKFNIRKYLQKKAYYCQSFDNYINKWGKHDKDIKQQLGFNYRYLGVFMENGKWKKLLSHPILALSMYYLRFLVGLNYLLK